MSYKTKNIIKNVICVALVIAAIAGVFVIFSNKTKVIHPTFAAGSLDLSGKYVESETSLYTKDLIKCQGLTVTPDFETDTKYQIFWYNAGEEYLSCTSLLEEEYTSNVPSIAKYCRIVLMPNLEDELEEDDDFKFSLFNIPKFTSEITIRVAKLQNFEPENFFESARLKSEFFADSEHTITEDVTFVQNAYIKLKGNNTYSDLYSYTDALSEKTVEGYDVDEFNGYGVLKVNCSNVEVYQFTFENNSDYYYEVFFYDSNGVGIKGVKLTVNDKTIHKVEVPSSAEYMCINVFPENLEKGGDSVPFKLNEYFLRTYTSNY